MKSAAAFRFDRLRLRGRSRAGDETWFRVDPPGLALDVGRGATPLIGARWLFLSHGHLDHAVGIGWVLTQRKLQGLGTPVIFCPREIASDLRAFIEAAGRLENESLEAEVVGVAPGDTRELKAGLRLEVFATEHTVPSLGCHLIRRFDRLRADLDGLPAEEIARRKAAGERIVKPTEELWLSYSGDTSAGVFDQEPRVFEAKILILECTFMGEQMRARARRFGHIHLQDLVEVSSRFQNQAIVLSHLSRRHRWTDLEEAVKRELPGLAERVHVLATDSLGARA